MIILSAQTALFHFKFKLRSLAQYAFNYFELDWYVLVGSFQISILSLLDSWYNECNAIICELQWINALAQNFEMKMSMRYNIRINVEGRSEIYKQGNAHISFSRWTWWFKISKIKQIYRWNYLIDNVV